MIPREFHPRVVLVRTLYESNIGATSRAMANMGVKDLILIDPQCQIGLKAQKAAATGQSALQNRRVYADWNDFHKSEHEGLRLAFTARDGKGRLVEDCSTTLRGLAEKDPRFSKAGDALPVYLIFGPEDAGLAAEDLKSAHHAVSIPTYGDNPSLNLAQATLLALFILRTEWGGREFSLATRGEEAEFQKSTSFPEDSLRDFLEAMGFSLANPKTNAFTVLRRLFLRTVPTQKESKLLEIVFQQGARKIRKK